MSKSIDVSAVVEADGTLRCEITAGTRKATVRFTDEEITLAVPAPAGT